MPVNPTTEGPVKSLRQVPPGGDIIPGLFGLFSAYLLLSTVVNRPESGVGWILALFFVAAFGVPAYVLFASSRGTGVFVTDERVEYRLMGQPRLSWSRAEVSTIEPMGGGMKLLGQDGKVLREFKFRWWNTEQVARFARATGLAPASPEMKPGEAGQA